MSSIVFDFRDVSRTPHTGGDVTWHDRGKFSLPEPIDSYLFLTE